jgi:hypothetical protein
LCNAVNKLTAEGLKSKLENKNMEGLKNDSTKKALRNENKEASYMIHTAQRHVAKLQHLLFYMKDKTKGMTSLLTPLIG